MERMFETSLLFNQLLSFWNVRTVTNMNAMFCHASSFNQPLATWDVWQVTDIQSMFQVHRRVHHRIADSLHRGGAKPSNLPNSAEHFFQAGLNSRTIAVPADHSAPGCRSCSA